MKPLTTAARRPLKIAVLGSTYARFHEDNQVPWLRESVNRLARRGHHVTVIASAYHGAPSHEIDGIPVRRFRYAPKWVEHLTHDEGAPNKLRHSGNPLGAQRTLRCHPDALAVPARFHWLGGCVCLRRKDSRYLSWRGTGHGAPWERSAGGIALVFNEVHAHFLQ